MEYNYFIFEYGCAYDCIFIKDLTDALNVNTELYMLCTNILEPLLDNNSCICFERRYDAVHYISLLKIKTLFVEAVHCLNLLKMIKNSNYHIGLTIKKKKNIFLGYMQYLDILTQQYALHL